MNFLGVGLLVVFGLVWSGAVGALDAKLWRDLSRQFNSGSFPSVTGQVIHSEVTTRRGSKGGVIYGVRMSYQFTVEDRLFAGSRYRYNSSMNSSGSRWAHATVASHPVGSAVTVFYNPANPGDALLSPGIGGEDLLALLFMTPFNLIVLATWWLPIAAARQKYFPKPAGGVRILEDPPRLRLRLPSYSPWIALPVIFGLCFVGMIVVSMVSEGHPSIALVSWVWLLILAIGAGIFAWRWRRIRSGVEDLVLDESDGRMNLPMTCGRKTLVTVHSSEVQAVTVEKVLRQRNRGRSSYWFCPTLQLGPNQPSARLAQWTSQIRARKFAQWLGERLHVGGPNP